MSILRPDVALAGLTDGVRFLTLDVETTPSDTGDRVVSVGFVQVDARGKTLAAATEWLYDPGSRIENTRIHGLTDADVVGQPALSTRMDALDAALAPRRPGERSYLVAHNASFDVGVLRLEYHRAGREFPDVAVLDTLLLARYFMVGAGGYKLPQLLAYYGLSITQHHNALADARDTAALLRRLLDHAARAGHTGLDELLAVAQAGRVRTAGFEQRAGARTERAGAGSPYTFIDRPVSHQATHKNLPTKATDADVARWLSGLRSVCACVARSWRTRQPDSHPPVNSCSRSCSQTFASTSGQDATSTPTRLSAHSAASRRGSSSRPRCHVLRHEPEDPGRHDPLLGRGRAPVRRLR